MDRIYLRLTGILLLTFVLFTSVLFTSCTEDSTKNKTPSPKGEEKTKIQDESKNKTENKTSGDDVSSEIDVNEFEKLMNEEGYEILDVRTKGEYEQSRIGNPPNNIDVNDDDFEEKIKKLDKNKIYLVYCRSGIRSERARQIMKENGFKAINMGGGILEWENQNKPVIKGNTP